MIVIATHNSPDNLGRLLQSMRVHGTDGEKVLIVASGSPEYKELVETTVAHRALPNLDWIPNDNDSFEAGAWVEAYRNHPDKTYLFLQDSMEVTGAGWYQQFVHRGEQAAKAGVKDFCIPWVTFTPYLLGVTPEVRDRIISMYGLMAEPGFGIFGSMFYVTRPALERVEAAGYLNYLPRNKVDSEAFERWWALFFHRLQIPMFALHANAYSELHATGEAFPMLRKHFHTRNGGQR